MSHSESQSRSEPVCVITGGSSGVGLATAKLFARNGFNICICGRNATRLEAAKSEIESFGAICESSTVDLGKNPENAGSVAEQAFEKWGRIDILVNNAAMAPLAPFQEIDPAIFEATINLNHRAIFYLTQSVWRKMLQQDSGGKVVNISSLAAVDPFPGFSIYGASKAWLDLFTIALAAEGKEKNIDVFSIRPGAVETPLLRSLFPDFPADQAVSADDVAARIWNVCQPEMKSSSGQAFEVSNQT